MSYAVPLERGRSFVLLSGLTSNPTFGTSAESGVPLTVVAANFPVGDTLSYLWRTVNSATPLSTLITFTPNSDTLDLEDIYCVVTSSSGVVRQSTPVKVRRVPPVAGTLVPINVVQGLGNPTRDLDTGFVGNGLVYSEDVPWASISANILTVVDAVISAEVLITATNSGGSATINLSVVITSPI